MATIISAPHLRSTVGGMGVSSRAAMEGAGELIAKFQRLTREGQVRVADPALEAAAEIIARSQQREAPVDSGAIVQAIRVTPKGIRKRSLTWEVAVGKGWFTGETFYAGFVEFGHSTASRKARRIFSAEPAKRFRKELTARTIKKSDSKESKKQQRRAITALVRGERERITALEFGSRKVPPNPFMRRGYERSKGKAFVVARRIMEQKLWAEARR